MINKSDVWGKKFVVGISYLLPEDGPTWPQLHTKAVPRNILCVAVGLYCEMP